MQPSLFRQVRYAGGAKVSHDTISRIVFDVTGISPAPLALLHVISLKLGSDTTRSGIQFGMEPNASGTRDIPAKVKTSHMVVIWDVLFRATLVVVCMVDDLNARRVRVQNLAVWVVGGL